MPKKIADAAREDPLVFGISYVDLLDGKQWTLKNREWSVLPYQLLNPARITLKPTDEPRVMAITKSTQAGISTMAIVKALHALTYWPMRIGYMLPRQKDVSDFSSTRLVPMLNGSEFIKARKKPFPDSVSTKGYGKGYLFFLEGSVEPRSMPMDMLYLDEVDLCDPDHVGTAINRMDDSQWKLLTYLSTPTLPNYGIDAVFENSNMQEWAVKCRYCGHNQIIDWDEHLRIRGPHDSPDHVWFFCERCEHEITLDNMRDGEWVPQYPSRKNIIGFRVSQIYTTAADVLYAHFRDPNQTITEFYRKRLGKPFTFGGGSVSREDFLINCFDEPYDIEDEPDGESMYYMGVDQGNQLQVAVGKIEKKSTRPKVVHAEIVPFDEGFERIGKLMRLFKIKVAVVDADPNRHEVKKLVKAFPGRVLMADYNEQSELFTLKKEDEKLKYNTNVTISRTENFDTLVNSITSGEWQLPGTPPRLHSSIELLIDQVTAIRRDVEVRKTLSGERQVAVWKKVRADHFAHSMGYLQIAIRSRQKRHFRFSRIGGY